VYDNSVLRKILGPERGEVTGDVRRLHCEDLHYLYYQPDAIWLIKSRRVRGVMLHMWRREEMQIGFWPRNLKERNHFEDLCVDGRMVL